jgi:hypothetical protein
MSKAKRKLTKRELLLELQRWANSLNFFDSEKLSSIGIDDSGDLADHVPSYKKWMDEFWGLMDK